MESFMHKLAGVSPMMGVYRRSSHQGTLSIRQPLVILFKHSSVCWIVTAADWAAVVGWCCASCALLEEHEGRFGPTPNGQLSQHSARKEQGPKHPAFPIGMIE
ncbi:hypothetical protein ABW19_dt0206174 [Dactylella cylindrospora]|nr:hypothetical protein ABW19_dt0206174 [Dactylella cylindrospora]